MRLLDELMKGTVPKDLAFSQEDYRARVTTLRKRMEQAGLDAVLVSSTANICYLIGYETAMPSGHAVAIVPLKGDTTLQVSTWDLPTAMLTSHVDHFAVLEWYDLDRNQHLAKVLVEHGLSEGRIGVEATKASTYAIGAMDAGALARLKELLPRADFVDMTRLVLDLRLIKTSAEIAYMRRAAEFSAEGIRAAFAAVVPGNTDNVVAAAAYEAMVSAGSELMSIDPQIMTGRRTGWGPHVTYKRVPLVPGDPVYLECSACYRRYCAPMMRTTCLGQPSDDVRLLADVSITTLQVLLAKIKPGRTAHDVAMDAREALAPVKDRVYFHGSFSYSVGLSFPPYQSDVPMYIAEGNEQVLQAGMTLHLPIYLFIPGRCGAGFSETVAVTASGCEVLTGGYPRSLEFR